MFMNGFRKLIAAALIGGVVLATSAAYAAPVQKTTPAKAVAKHHKAEPSKKSHKKHAKKHAGKKTTHKHRHHKAQR